MGKTMVKDGNFICIQGWMLTKLKLKGNDLLVYAIIYGYSQDGSSCFSGGLRYLADWVNGTKRGVKKNLDNLESKGLIQKESYMADGISTVKYKCNLKAISECGQDDFERELEDNHNIGTESNIEEPEIKENKNNAKKGVEQSSIGIEQSSIEHRTEFHRGMEQSSMGCRTEFHGGMEQSSPNNIYIIKDNIKDTSKGGEPEWMEQAREVIISAWNRLESLGISPIKAISTQSMRYRMLNARIKGYGCTEVIRAVENIKKSRFLAGDNARGWIIDFDWFIKPSNFIKVWEGKYTDVKKGGDRSMQKCETSGEAKRYNPADFFGDSWNDTSRNNVDGVATMQESSRK